MLNDESTNVRYIDEKKTSRITGLSIQTLRNQRFKGEGIPYCKIGRSVRYNLAEVHAYMESHRIKTDE